MKTNAFRYLGLALMAVLTLSLTSCEVEIDSFYDDDNIGGGYYNRSSDLCSRTWVSFYRDVDGNRCRQELDFYLDRTGVDFIRVEYPNGHVETFEYHFRWNWENYAQTSIRMDYETILISPRKSGRGINPLAARSPISIARFLVRRMKKRCRWANIHCNSIRWERQTDRK